MEHCIGCDAHKKYSVFEQMDERGRFGPSARVPHEREVFDRFLRMLPPRSSIAVECMGNWYWLIDAMEEAGHKPILVHPRKAKLMMGQINKTDKLDARGLAMLQRNGTLPEVWIPSGELRDQRELPRTRMALVSIRTKLKNRIHASWAKYNIRFDETSDCFNAKGRALMEKSLPDLPPETRRTVKEELTLLDETEARIRQIEARIKEVIKETEAMRLLMTLPGLGPVLATVVALEIGSVDRFPDAMHLASYSGTTPRIHSSGGRTYFGKTRPDVNRYLKWAFTEAANVIAIGQRFHPEAHVSRLYKRLRERKGHQKAVVAVARHLAEAAYWMLKRKEPYRAPQPVSSTQR